MLLLLFDVNDIQWHQSTIDDTLEYFFFPFHPSYVFLVVVVGRPLREPSFFLLAKPKKFRSEVFKIDSVRKRLDSSKIVVLLLQPCRREGHFRVVLSWHQGQRRDTISTTTCTRHWPVERHYSVPTFIISWPASFCHRSINIASEQKIDRYIFVWFLYR